MYRLHLSCFANVQLCGRFVSDIILNSGFPRLLESPGFFLENHFGPGKSWKLKLKVLESPGKISLKDMNFSSGSNGKQAAIVQHILFHAEFSAMDYTLNIVSKCRFFSLHLNIRGLRKRPVKFFKGVLESPRFFVSKRVGTLLITYVLFS